MLLPLLAELQRRRVFRALVGYGIVAFAVLQIVEPVMHGFHWPEVVLSYVVLALAAGFPLVVGLAWIFDVNAGRFERTPPAPHASGLRGAPLALVLAGIGALAAAPGLVWYFVLRGGNPAAAASARPPSIAVLPFVNLSGGQENEYFSDGVTEEIINALANVDGLRVVARTSAFSFKGKSLNVRQIGDDLNVATVLEGSVRREGNQLRLTAQLIDAANGYHLMSKTWDREVKGVFALEDDLARAIVRELKPRLVRGAALVQQTTVSPEAHDLYLRGRYFWNQRTKEGMTRAVALFEQAIAIDPGYALAHSGLADAYDLSIDYADARAAEVIPKAKAHALKAVELDDRLAEAHASLGLVYEQDFQWSAAERELKRAIELRSGYATAHHWYALVLSFVGRASEAAAEMEQARQLDPTSTIVNVAATALMFVRSDYQAAAAQAAKTIEMNPAADYARMWLAMANARLGRFAEALAPLDEAPLQNSLLRTTRAHVLAASGDRAKAMRLLADIEQHFDAEPARRGDLALVHVLLDDKDGAFEWLKRGIDERDQSVFGLKVNPLWDPLRSDPRYHALLERMNLE